MVHTSFRIEGTDSGEWWVVVDIQTGITVEPVKRMLECLLGDK